MVAQKIEAMEDNKSPGEDGIPQKNTIGNSECKCFH